MSCPCTATDVAVAHPVKLTHFFAYPDIGCGERLQLAAIHYEMNIMGTKGPRRMVALIPSLNNQGFPVPFRPEYETDSLLDRCAGQWHRDLRNTPPENIMKLW